MKRERTIVSCALLAVGLNAVAAPTVAERVAADFTNGTAVAFRHYAVPAMSELQRLEDAYPTDGVAGGTVGIVLAQDEYEPAAFEIWAERDLGKVTFEVGDLKQVEVEKVGRGGGGEVVFPKEDLDLKLVKVWYQNLNAWFGHFADSGSKLCPELLVNDEDLIRVDTAKKANYARIEVGSKNEEGGSGDARHAYRWINPPRQYEMRSVPGTSEKQTWFEYMKEDFRDAKTLQPVTLPKHAFRCFFLTAHAHKGTKPGLYRGAITLKSAKDGAKLGEVPVAIRVLDFALPQPKCYETPEKDFLVSFYTYVKLDLIRRVNGGDDALAYRQLVAIYRDGVEHNQPIHWVSGNMDNNAYQTRKALAEAGGRMDILLGGAFPIIGKGWVCDQDGLPQRIADECDRRYGHHNVYIGYGDEVGPDWLMLVRPIYDEYRKSGLKFIIAGSDNIFNAAGYHYDWYNAAATPEDARYPHKWNVLQNNNRVAWYANQHVGSENPAYSRRQNGLAAWLSGYTALCNYAHHLGPYNDDQLYYRPMVYAYGTGDGVLDTIQWEGFREGVDDIRYATLLTALARKAQSSADLATRYLGGEAMLFLAKVNARSYDADAVRLDMIERIGRLRKAVGEVTFTSDVKNDPVAAKRGAARAEANLKAALEKAAKGFAAAKTAAASNTVHVAIAKVYARYLRAEEGGDYLMKHGLPEKALAYYDYLPEKRAAAKAAMKKTPAAKPAAPAKAKSEAEMKPAELLYATFEKALGTTDRGVEEMRKDVTAVVSDPRFAKIAAKDRADALCKLGSAMNGACRENAVRAIDACRKALYKPQPKRRYAVRYSEVSVAGINDFEKVPGEAAAMDRAFGGNVEFLVTDVASGNRGNVGSSKEKFKPPRMKVAADAEGLHVLVDVADPKASGMILGNESTGTFEMYLAPGANTPYVCCVAEPGSTAVPTLFNTTYDTFRTRMLKPDDFGSLTRIRTQFRKDGFVIRFFYSWRNWAGRIPQNGTLWDFENVYWNRVGGLCWNGLETVHGRSTWGELVFALSDAQRAAILRPLLGAAHACYGRAKHRGHGWEGMLSRWKDPVTGDADFYKSVVEPLVGELDAGLKAVTAEMDDKAVLDCENTWLPRWTDVEFDIQRRRAAYLKERLLK